MINVVVLDESGVNLNFTREYARAPVNERAIGSRPNHRGKRLNILACLTAHGWLAPMVFEGNIDEELFGDYIQEVLLPALTPAQKLLLDNASFHKLDALQEQFDSQKKDFQFLPAYSPDLSPIELAWSKVKKHIKDVAPRTKEELINAIGEAMQSVTEQDIDGYFRHCGFS
jgi:transposase